MTTDKDFKRLVRTRMRKTGEAYTAARAQLRAEPRSDTRSKTSAVPSVVAPADYAKLAGKSDAILKQRTGCTWERWVKALDHAGAHDWTHGEIARHVVDKYKTPGWWAQTVTVGYERIKGLRAVGQRRSGAFEASKSRTFAVPLARLYRSFHDARQRKRWLPDVSLTVRSATPEKYMRITWPDRTSVAIGFLAKGSAKSQVAIQHEKLPDKAAAVRLKAYWAERLDALGELLGPRAS
jgi:hypothetical protein